MTNDALKEVKPLQKTGITAVMSGIVSLAYFLLFGMFILLTLAFGTLWIVLGLITVPVCLSFLGLPMSIYAAARGGRKSLCIIGITLNTIAICIIIFIIILIVRNYNYLTGGGWEFY